MSTDPRLPPEVSARMPSERLQSTSRNRRLRQELLIRALVVGVILGFHEIFRATTGGRSDTVILTTLLLALVLNGPYYIAARMAPWPHFQAYARMLLDIVFITVGLNSAGGLAAAPYLAVYTLVPIYAGIVFSSTACLVATGAATASYLTLVSLQQGGWVTSLEQPLPSSVAVAAFNLLIINVVGGLTALLALALRRSRQRLRTTYRELSNLMETIPDVIWVVDLTGSLLLWNRKLEMLSGLPPAQLRERQVGTLFAEPDRARVADALREGAEQGQFDFEGHLLSAASSAAVPHHWTGAWLRDDDGRVTGLTGVGRDLTSRKQAEELIRQQEDEVRQLQKMEAVGRLAGGIAHDFNNLLQVIKGRAEYLLLGLPPQDATRSGITKIQEAADRGAALIRQLLAFSRKQILQPQVLALNAVVANVAQMLERLLGAEINLEILPDPNVGCVKGDLAQLEQVIMNLSINARDAMPGGGRLTIATRRLEVDEALARQYEGAHPGPCVVLEVSDTGVGIDPVLRSRIFEPFFTTKPVGKGTGLGLATVYGIVKQHDGWISLDSVPSQGTTFRIYLPSAEATPEERTGDRVTTEVPRGSETILVVEDEEAVRTLACDLLRFAGYRVLEAANGREALTVAGRQAYAIDGLVTDVVMPEMNGIELAGRLRSQQPALPVLFMSGHTEDLVQHGAAAAPGTAFLRKPFTAVGLTQGVRQVLDHALEPTTAPWSSQVPHAATSCGTSDSTRRCPLS